MKCPNCGEECRQDDLFGRFGYAAWECDACGWHEDYDVDTTIRDMPATEPVPWHGNDDCGDRAKTGR